MVGYTPKWFTCPQTITHPGSHFVATRSWTHDLFSPMYSLKHCNWWNSV